MEEVGTNVSSCVGTFHLFAFCVFASCEQMNLPGSDKVVIKNSISGSRFVVSSAARKQWLRGSRRGRWNREVGLCEGWGRKCTKKQKAKAHVRKGGRRTERETER